MSNRIADRMFTEDELESIFKVVDEATAQFIKNLPQKITAVLDEALISAIGYTRRYGRLEIDHSSAASKLITEKTIEALRQMLDSKVELLKLEAAKNTYDSVLKAEFLREYRSTFKCQVQKFAREQAEQDANILMHRIKAIKLRKLDDFKKELCDPDAYTTAVGEAILEAAIENGTVGQL